jgi:hypothetical protein
VAELLAVLLDARVDRIAKDIHATYLEYGTERGGLISYVKGANIGGLIRVADAMLDQGVVQAKSADRVFFSNGSGEGRPRPQLTSSSTR